MLNFEHQHLINSNNQALIKASDCFEALTPDQKILVENSTSLLEFKKGETIIKQGFVASHILYIESGLVKLDVTNDGKTSTVRLLGKDAFVGIVCSFACRNLDFSAISLEPTSIRMINMDVFYSLIKENGEFALKLIRHMSMGTNSMVHWMSRLNGKNVDGALAMMLKEFSMNYESDSFTLPVTRIGLASLIGCSRESVINSLTQFHQDGIIDLKDKYVKILNAQSLERIIVNG